MAFEKAKDVAPSSFSKPHSNDNYKLKMKRDKIFQTKVVIRRLPPAMSEEQFLQQISPVPDHDYLHFVKADMRLGQHAFSRAYVNFTIQEDIFMFKEKFDGYVFLDIKGNEYPAIVEFAPFQKIPKKRSKKRDTKCGTIFQDPDYEKFLENLRNPDDSILPTAEAYLEEIESREKELKANNGVLKMTTPLIEYLKQRKLEQQIRDEKREERKRKELEKKRIREDERRRRKAEKEKSREKVKDKIRDKEIQSEKETIEEIDESPISEDSKLPEPVVQVLKNPEREKEQKTHTVIPKSKEFFSVLRSSNKERNRLDWAQERDKQRDRMRMKDRRVCEKSGVGREKERSRRDRIELRTQHSESNKKAEFSGSGGDVIETKHVNIGNNISVETSKESFEDCKNDAQKLESKWASKGKRDNSCPGDVEPLGNKNLNEKSICKQSKANSSRTPSEDSAEVNESCKSDGCLVDSSDPSKDPRVDRRIRNKDRPSLEIYRPGMRRFSAQRNSPQKEISTSTSNSSTPSPSPTPPLTVSKSHNKDGNKNKIPKNTSDAAASCHSQEDM